MGYDQNGLSVLVQLGKHVKDIVCRLHVHASCRLICQKKLGGIGQRYGDCHSLLLTAGEHIHAALLLVTHPDHLEKPQRLLPLLLCTGQTHRKHDIFQHCQIRKQVSAVILPDEADRVSLVQHQLLLRHGEQVAAGHKQ